jgi:hypothetical protein
MNLHLVALGHSKGTSGLVHRSESNLDGGGTLEMVPTKKCKRSKGGLSCNSDKVDTGQHPLCQTGM